MPEPAAAMTRPPIAGPMARATLKPAEFQATPAAKLRCETISGVIACHAGSFSTAPKPISSVSSKQQARRDPAGQRQRAECGGGQHHPGLGEEQQLAPVDHVGDGARRQHHQKYGNAARCLHQSDHQRRHGERGHQPGGADVLHPGAGVADDGGNPKSAEERLVQRAEHAVRRGAIGSSAESSLNSATGVTRPDVFARRWQDWCRTT